MSHKNTRVSAMAIKKSELYSTLWASCDKLRGGMDASQYKDYVLVLLFVKYVSDKYTNNPDGSIIIPIGGGFQDMIALKGQKEIGDRINTIIGELAKRFNRTFGLYKITSLGYLVLSLL